MPSEVLVLAHEPPDQEVVHMFPHTSHRRWVESPVVVRPAPKSGIEHVREVAEFLVALELDVPAPDPLSHRLHSLTTDGRSEVHVDATILVDRLARSKRIAEKRELDRRECLL